MTSSNSHCSGVGTLEGIAIKCEGCQGSGLWNEHMRTNITFPFCTALTRPVVSYLAPNYELVFETSPYMWYMSGLHAGGQHNTLSAPLAMRSGENSTAQVRKTIVEPVKYYNVRAGTAKHSSRSDSNSEKTLTGNTYM